MLHSIRRQIAFVTCALTICTLFLCWGINNIFLEKVYYSEKQGALKKMYDSLNQVNGIEEIYTEDFDLKMEEYCDNYNMSVMVMDTSLHVVYSSTNSDDRTLIVPLHNYIYGDSYDVNGNYTTEIESTNHYKLTKTRDTRFNTDYMEMVGSLNCGYFFVTRTALESVHENVAVSNRFLAYVAIAVMLVATVCILYMSDRITRPLQRLIAISAQMTQLNFDAKYVGESTEEIDTLGENMNKLSEKLEETISDLKTANNELKRDIEQKIQIDEMRKDFLSNVSHELKTPIALIQGYAEGLKECINDDEESRNFYCEVIMDEAAKMNGMVQKLLTLNQIEFGNDTVSMERFDITAVVNNIISSMKLLAEQKEVSISCNTKKPVYVWSDEFKVEEVFTNYMSNALNHASKEKKVDVRIKKQDKEVRISVFNTGNPIPEEDIEKIWIKFYKVDKARTREYGGSGIGLSIVKAIMDSLHQKCGVINYENGVEFWFTLDSE